MSDILGVTIPAADAVEVARALIPSGPIGGPLQRDLVPEGLIKGQQQYLASLPGGAAPPAVLTPEQAARIKASEDRQMRGKAVLTPEQAARIEAAQRIPKKGSDKRPREM